jgi:hypothetical protein
LVFLVCVFPIQTMILTQGINTASQTDRNLCAAKSAGAFTASRSFPLPRYTSGSTMIRQLYAQNALSMQSLAQRRDTRSTWLF